MSVGLSFPRGERQVGSGAIETGGFSSGSLALGPLALGQLLLLALHSCFTQAAQVADD